VSEETLFHKILAGDIPSDKVYEDENVFAFRDINPQAPTHILIIHKKHDVPQISKMQESDVTAMGQLLYAAKKVADQEGIEDYRLVINNGEGVGQTVFYVHLHLLGGREMGWPPG